MTGATPPPGTGRWAVVAVVLAFVLVGAGVLLMKRPEPVPVVKVSPGPPAAPEQPLAHYLARADAVRGEAQFARCLGCHNIEQGAPHGVGPNLWGVMGARTAARPVSIIRRRSGRRAGSGIGSGPAASCARPATSRRARG